MIDGALRLGAPTTLLKRAYFAGSTVLSLDLRGYDVAPDGSRFLMIKDAAAAPLSTAAVDVVVGWGDRLRVVAKSSTALP